MTDWMHTEGPELEAGMGQLMQVHEQEPRKGQTVQVSNVRADQGTNSSQQSGQELGWGQ